MIIDFIKGLNHVEQALLATLFTWFVTALGSGLVFLFKNINKKLMDGMMGFAAGVMIAASFWSLLAPSIKMSEQWTFTILDATSYRIFSWWRIFICCK